MLGFKAFARKPRQFEYKPRHFDPEKEAREERRKELLGDDAQPLEEKEKEYRPGLYIRQSMYARRGIGSSRTAESRKANKIRVLVVIFLFIILGIYWFI